MSIKIVEVTPLHDRIVHVVFSDGLEKAIDLMPLLVQTAAFNRVRLSDRVFRRVQNSDYAIMWPIFGEPGIDADILYEDPADWPGYGAEPVNEADDQDIQPLPAQQKRLHQIFSWDYLKHRTWYWGIRPRIVSLLDWFATIRHKEHT